MRGQSKYTLEPTEDLIPAEASHGREFVERRRRKGFVSEAFAHQADVGGWEVELSPPAAMPAHERDAAVDERFLAGERIVAVGSDPEILPLAASRTNKLDLAGKTVTPGFCDSHIHLLWYGLQLLNQADLVASSSIDEILSRLSSQAAKTDGWIQGHGFDQDKLREKRW